MNGPEHYRRAEKLIEKAVVQIPQAGAPMTAAMMGAEIRLKAAAVHAQLAAVAIAYDALPDHIQNEAGWADATKPTT